jgi:hypothetical protein
MVKFAEKTGEEGPEMATQQIRDRDSRRSRGGRNIEFGRTAERNLHGSGLDDRIAEHA